MGKDRHKKLLHVVYSAADKSLKLKDVILSKLTGPACRAGVPARSTNTLGQNRGPEMNLSYSKTVAEHSTIQYYVMMKMCMHFSLLGI